MKQQKIKVILVLVIILSIFLPIIFRSNNETANQTITNISTIVGSFASLFTLIIAILLFNKFGIETPLLEKNTTIVFEFIEELKKSKLSLQGDNFFMMISMHNPHEIIINSPFPESWYYDKNLIFSENYNKCLLRLFEISDNPFMPKTICEKVQKLNCHLLLMNVDWHDSQYTKVRVPGELEIDIEYGRFNGKDITLFDFLNLIEDVKVELVKWITKNSDYTPDLNI